MHDFQDNPRDCDASRPLDGTVPKVPDTAVVWDRNFEDGGDQAPSEPVEWTVPECSDEAGFGREDDLPAGSRQDSASKEPRNPTVFTWLVRRRIRETWVQSHGVGSARMKAAVVPGDVASWHGLKRELASLVDARRRGTRADVRAALVAVACTCIFLAEQQDRPAEHRKGERRQKNTRWEPIDFNHR